MTLKALLAPALLSILCSAMPFVAHATSESDGGSHGGGGAGICINGRCVSLAEAGFRIPQDQQIANTGYMVDLDVMKQLDLISQMFPEAGLYTAKIIGEPGTLTMLEVNQQGRAKSFLEKYKKMLAKNGDKELAKQTVLLGFTIDKKTYLISDRYKALGSARSRALLLIHEYNIRRGISQETAVQFDGALIDAMKAVEQGRPVNARSFLGALVGIGSVGASTLMTEKLGEVLARAGGWVRSEDLPNTGSESISISYDAILRARAVLPTIANEITPGSFSVIRTYGFNRDKILERLIQFAAADLTKQKTTVNIDQHTMDRFLAQEPVATRQLLEACGSIRNEGSILRGARTNDFNTDKADPNGRYAFPEAASCAVQSQRGYSLFWDMVGTKLNLKTTVTCFNVKLGYAEGIDCRAN